jgi:hypothetical protein
MAVAPIAKPEAIAPSELWTKLAQSKRPTKEVDFPRIDPATGESIGKLLMRPLNQGELLAAQAGAMRFAKELLKNEPELLPQIEQSAVFQNACACEILFRACRRIENADMPVFPTAASVRDPINGLSHDECGVLMRDYEFVQLELGPIASYLSEEQQEALIKRLQEGGSAVPLASLSLGQWTDLTMHMASRCATSQTVNFTPGSPPEDLTSSE